MKVIMKMRNNTFIADLHMYIIVEIRSMFNISCLTLIFISPSTTKVILFGLNPGPLGHSDLYSPKNKYKKTMQVNQNILDLNILNTISRFFPRNLI